MSRDVTVSEPRVAAGAPNRVGNLIVTEHLEHDADGDDREGDQHDQSQPGPASTTDKANDTASLSGFHCGAADVLAPVAVRFRRRETGHDRGEGRYRRNRPLPPQISPRHDVAPSDRRPAHTATTASDGTVTNEPINPILSPVPYPSRCPR